MDPYGPYWEALELAPGSDPDAIKRAYREAALTWHPDRFPYDPELRARCEERMRHVNAAYEALRELADGGAPPLPESSAAWRPAPEPESEPEPEEAPAFVDRWLGSPRPRAPEPPVKARREDPPPWAGLDRMALALGLASAAMLAIFSLGHGAGTGYGKAVRIIAGPALAYASAAAAARGVWEVAMGLALLAFAVNPLLPVPMSLEEWRIFNAVTPPMLAGMWYWVSKRR